MKKHDNTLYVTTQGAYLSRDGTNVVVSVEKKERLRLPIHTIEGIVCFGNVGSSPFLLGMCGQEHVGVSFCTENGRFLARLHGPQSGNVHLRRAQHEAGRAETICVSAARWFVQAKLANCRALLLRALRDHGDNVDKSRLESAQRRLAIIIGELSRIENLERIRGAEGEGARCYYSAFDDLIVAEKDDFRFSSRNRRPPTDPVNAMLSFIYTLLAHDAASACEAVGLDPQMGFLHADRSGRASLGLDLMEEFRAMIADRLTLTLINRRQVAKSGFIVRENGAVEMDDKTRKTILVSYQERKREEIHHRFLDEPVTIGALLCVQARLLARWLRGDLDAYPAFFWK
jgi:CRISPR-associated protein Cas1